MTQKPQRNTAYKLAYKLTGLLTLLSYEAQDDLSSSTAHNGWALPYHSSTKKRGNITEIFFFSVEVLSSQIHSLCQVGNKQINKLNQYTLQSHCKKRFIDHIGKKKKHAS